MSLSLVNALRLKLDDWRVRQHFRRVESILSTEDVSHLSPQLQQMRDQHLNRLHTYAARGVFPRNHEYPGYAPCFIDRDGRVCAVAHLMIESGHIQTAANISTGANYAYVPQMDFPELDDWAEETGLSKEELALIQPGYWSSFSGTLLSLTLAIWSAGIVAILINTVRFIRKQVGVLGPIFGFAAAMVLLVLTLGLLWLWWEAYGVGMGYGYDGYRLELALYDAGPLGAAAVVSLGIALLAGWLSVRKARNNNHQFINDDDPNSAN